MNNGKSQLSFVPPLSLITVFISVSLGLIGATQFGVLIVLLSVVTVPQNDSSLPVHIARLPRVIPAASITVPAKNAFAPIVVAALGVHHTSQADVLLDSLTAELATVVRAQFILNINEPLPVSVIPAAPIEAAPFTQ